MSQTTSITRRGFCKGLGSCAGLIGSTLVRSLALGQDPTPIPVAAGSNDAWVEAVQSHFDRFTLYCTDQRGRTRSGIWSIDWDARAVRPGVTSHLALSMPSVSAALELASRTGCKCYTEAAESHLKSLLHVSAAQFDKLPMFDSCVYDFDVDKFTENDSGLIARLSPDQWDLLAKHAPDATLETVDRFSTFFSVSESFRNIAASSVNTTIISLCDSTLWALSKGLIRMDFGPSLDRYQARFMNAPLPDRGRWIQSLIHASQTLDRSELVASAEQCVDEQAATVTQDDLSSPDLSFVAAHPMDYADAMRMLFDATGQDTYLRLAKSFVTMLQDAGLPPETAIARDYGESLKFLVAMREHVDVDETIESLAEQAMGVLFLEKSGVFQSRPGSGRCRDAEGIGLLLQSMLQIA
ncbi:hypothetical protein [Stieleria varia]|uniref:Uncharacterized protein n=1 Tax=Stieleria varia TaxID=2528005 RepID=A0A5C6B0R1_9BACT|nr:hypothetical protein [Stieleria varia]TWU04982.1 hypothetical protein Pla52n_30270 [Stieleria varia]